MNLSIRASVRVVSFSLSSMRSFFSRALCSAVLIFGFLLPFVVAPAPAHAQETPLPPAPPTLTPEQSAALTPAQRQQRANQTAVREAEILRRRDAGNSGLSGFLRALNPEQDLSVNMQTGETTRETATQAANRIGRDAVGLPPTGAGSITDALTAKLVGFIAFMMGLIVSFLGKVILLLVNILLGFLSYNSFADAPPVVIGWKIVRDLANMFFIVVLILSSYATILGVKKELHVRDVLPKILLAAVLVNFSKTIVSLLIDASQVVMLTFVNAFAAIGAGNFTNALHLPLITSASYGDQLQQIGSATTTPAIAAAGSSGQVILDVVLASALQIFLLVVAIGVMLMMIIFVAVRIVGLWMLLVFSPIPFLADALPGSIKNILGKQVSEFWGRLSGLLTGGPVMAFWLWLTFATLSAQGADERLGLFQNTQAAVQSGGFNVAQNGASMFITAIGNAQGLGSYVIAIAMMLMGLEAAMGAAGEINKMSSAAGGLMKGVGDRTRKYAQRAALYGAGGGALVAGGALAYGAGRLAGGVTSGAAGLVNRRFDVTGKLAGAARKLPFAGNNEWLRKQQYANRDAAVKRAMENSKILNNPLATDEEKKAEINNLRVKFGMGGDPAVQRALGEDYLKSASNPKSYDGALKPMKDGIKDRVKGDSKDAVVAKRVSDRLGKQAAMNKQLEDYEKAKQLITGDSKEAIEKRNSIDDAVKKLNKDNPHLITNADERKKQMGEVRQNFNSLDEDARSNFEVLKNFAVDGAFKESGGRLTVGDPAAIRATRKKLQGKNRENFDAMVSYVKESTGGVEMSRLANLSIEQDATDKRRVFEVTGAGDKATGNFTLSDTRKKAVSDVQANYSAGNQGTWAPGGTVTAAAGTALTNAAKTVGVGQVVQSVGRGADGTTDSTLRQAAVSGIAATTSSSLSSTSRYLAEKQKYIDSSGNEQEDTNARIMRDGKAPQGLKDRIGAQYELQVSEALPVLEGIEDLSQNEQIDFMAAMGQADISQSLDTRLMTNPEQLAAVKKIRTVVDENAGAVQEYFSSQDQTKMQQYEQYTEQKQYEAARAANPPTLEQRVQEAEFKGIRGKDDAARQAYFVAHPGTESSYKAYVRNEDRAAAVKGMTISDNDPDYVKYTKYNNARSAIRQFKNSGGKGSGGKSRGNGGSGAGRRNRGGGAAGGAPPAGAPPAGGPPATGGAATT